MAIRLKVSENQGRVPLRAIGGESAHAISPDNGNPYYVGARAYVTQTESGAMITVIDKDGTTTATVLNGTDGKGIASIEKTDSVGLTDIYTITFDDDSTTTFTVTNGENGADGADGVDGIDGFSPSATVEKVGNRAIITITDKDGTTTATVSDGESAQPTTTTPIMDGTASVGSETKYAKGDHVHPSDTSRVPTTRKINGVALTADINIITKGIDVSTGGKEIDMTTPTGSMQVYDTDAIDGKMADVGQQLAQIYVPKTTTVNGNALSGNITLDADDVSAIPTSAKGAASGVCPLDANSKVDSQYLPSYVDDVIEAYPVSGATALSAGWLSATSGGSALTPEAGKIYVLMADSDDYLANTQFRWGGTTYVKLSDGGVSSITNAEIDTIVAS